MSAETGEGGRCNLLRPFRVRTIGPGPAVRFDERSVLYNGTAVRSRLREGALRIQFSSDNAGVCARICQQRPIGCGDQGLSAYARVSHSVRTADQVGAAIKSADLGYAADALGRFTALIAGTKYKVCALRSQGSEMLRKVQVEAGGKAYSQVSMLEDRGHRARSQAKIVFLCIRQVDLVIGGHEITHTVEHKCAIEPSGSGSSGAGQSDQAAQSLGGRGDKLKEVCALQFRELSK